MKKIILFVIVSLTILFNTSTIIAQDTKQQKQAAKEAAIKALIDAQHYSFEAQTALPIGMKIRNLTPGYELKVRKDTVEAYLPYFGRAYSATIGSADDGIKFKTTDFKYTSTETKKGEWDITIAPKNAGDTRQLTLHVSKAGYASLQVMSNNKQSISFNGYIQ